MQLNKKIVSIILLSLFSLVFTSCGSDSSKSQIAYSDAVSYIDAVEFTGTVLVKKDGKEIVRKSVGYADKEAEVLNSETTRFRIGSLTKGFTALAIVQLQNAGLLNYDDPLSHYLPDFIRADEITIRHLLTHRSGVYEYVLFADDDQSYTPQELIALVQDRDLIFEPGSQFVYTNTNYLLLGAIIETVTKTDYASYIETNITVPLNMMDTEYSPNEPVEAIYAKGYKDTSQKQFAEFHDISIPYAAGALSSTLNDMELWAESFYDLSLVSQQDKEDIFSEEGYGFGWTTTKFDGRQAYFHTGGIPGFSAVLVLLPEKKGIIIILSNIDNTHVQIGEMVETFVKNEF